MLASCGACSLSARSCGVTKRVAEPLPRFFIVDSTRSVSASCCCRNLYRASRSCSVIACSNSLKKPLTPRAKRKACASPSASARTFLLLACAVTKLFRSISSAICAASFSCSTALAARCSASIRILAFSACALTSACFCSSSARSAISFSFNTSFCDFAFCISLMRFVVSAMISLSTFAVSESLTSHVVTSRCSNRTPRCS
mmetsp:Transcript_73363/g.122568  ORF Transcript_73363/g.122568 Transcript_73363/m.122568 type:complete len:201 (+) Transcript_73363:204-806(+)